MVRHRMAPAQFTVNLAILVMIASTLGAVAREPTHGGTLTAIIQPEPVILTATLNTAGPAGVVTGNIFDGLVDYDADLNLVPALAESWETAADGLALTLHLRHGVLWHDGVNFIKSATRQHPDPPHGNQVYGSLPISGSTGTPARPEPLIWPA